MGGTGRKAIGSWQVTQRLGTLRRRRDGSWPASNAPARRVRSFAVRRPASVGRHLLHLIDVRPRSLERARDQLARYQALRHPALPPLVDLFTHREQLAVVLERSDGVRLDEIKGYLDRDGERLPDAAIWLVGWRVSGALAQAHLARDRHGALAPILHGRLSLRDILVGRDGDVTLHGLCPLLSVVPVAEDDEVIEPAAAWTSPAFRRGEPLTPRADTYAVALAMHGLLTGEPPPQAHASPASLAAERPDVPSDVARSLDRALRGRARPTSAELAQRLEGLVRVTDGRRALADCLELHQALWGLWSPSGAEAPVDDGAPSTEAPSTEALSTEAPSTEAPSTEAPPAEAPPAEPSTARSPGAMARAGAKRDRIPLEAAPSRPAPEPAPEPDTEPEAAEPEPIALTRTLASAPDPALARVVERGLATVEVVDAASAPLARDGAAPPPEEPAASPPRGAPPPRWARAAEADHARWPLYVVAGVLVALLFWYATRQRATPEAAGRPLASATAGGAVEAAARPTPAQASPRDAPAPEERPAAPVTSAEPPADAAPSIEERAAVEPSLTEAERAAMEFTQGYLIARSPKVGAEVFVNGRSVGPVGAKNKVFCGRKFVRLGETREGRPPTIRWLTEGRPVDLACRDLTVVSLGASD